MIETLANSLIRHIQAFRQCVVAFSGGVDSAVVAAAAVKALGEDSLAVTAVSPSVASFEIGIAKSVADQIGIRHQLIETDEINDPQYVKNDGTRCFYCKSELYSKLSAIKKHVKSDVVLMNGTNLDDLGDYRPGLQAAANYDVKSPLVDLEIGKPNVRQLARHWGISIAEKPAAPCLASRIAYGQRVTPERLSMIERAEAFIRQLGFKELRVRFHEGDHARIEVPLADVQRLLDDPVNEVIRQTLIELGFKTIQVDLEGLRSGNLNNALPILSN